MGARRVGITVTSEGPVRIAKASVGAAWKHRVAQTRTVITISSHYMEHF